MDNDAKTTVDMSAEVGHINSTIEANTETNLSNSFDIEDSPNETATVAMKTLEGQTETKPISNTSSCANDMDASLKFLPLNSANDKPKISSDNCTSTISLDSCVIRSEQNDDADDDDNENASVVSNKDCKIDNAMENQKVTDESTTAHLETMLHSNDDTCASVSNKVSEHCQNTAGDKDDEIESIEKSNNDKQFPNTDENCKDFATEDNKEVNSDDSKGSDEMPNLVIEEGPSVNEDVEVVIDDRPANAGKECNDKNVESSEEVNSEENSIKQQPSSDECIEVVDVDAPEGRKEDLNVKSETVNGVTIKEISKEESSSSNVKSIEVIDVVCDTDKRNEIIEIIDIESDSDKGNENNLLQQPAPIGQKRRRSSKANSKSIPSPPQPSTPPKGGRGRSRGDFEVTKKHLEPFKLGWLREVVERATCSSPKRMWDVYYRSPDGAKKMRSMPDIINYLRLHPECGLTHENFTFCKTHIYREPFELTRKAKLRSQQTNSPKTPIQESNKTTKHENDKSPQKIQANKSKPTSQLIPTEKEDDTEIIICDDEPVTKKMKLSTCEDKSVNKDKPIINMPSPKRRRSKQHLAEMSKRQSNRSPKRNSAPATGRVNKTPNIYEKVYTKLTKPRNDYSRSLRTQSYTLETADNSADNVNNDNVVENNKAVEEEKSVENNNADDEATSILRSSLKDKMKKIIVKISKENKVDKSSNEEVPMMDVNLCSNRCPGCVGEIPSLQCIVCLCLFHPRCMGLNKAATNFICKRCNTSKLNRNLPQDKLCNDSSEKAESLTNSLEQNDLDSTDEEDNTTVSALAPEVVIQHEGSDQEDVPTTSPYCFPNVSTEPSSTIATSSQYSSILLNSKSNFIRPVPPLTPFPNLIPAPHLQSQLLASKRIIASSTYFPPPPISDTPLIRIASTPSYNTYSKVSFTATNTRPKVSTTNVCSPLVGNPPVCSPVRLISPQLLTTVKPPPLGIPRPALVQGSVNTGPPPLRLVAPTSIASNVGSCNRIVLPNNNGSCLVLTPQTGVLGPGTTTRLIGPFPSNSIPQIMVVNNKVIYVNPLAAQHLSEQRSHSVITTIAPVTQSLAISSSKDTAPETRASYIKSQQNNPYLAALLNSKEVKSANVKPTSVTISSSSVPVPAVAIIEGKISSTVTPKLTAVIPPSFPVSKCHSILHCSNTPTTTAATCPLPTVFVPGSGSLLESPYSNKSYTQEENLAKHMEERYKLCLPVTQTAVLTEGVSPSLLNTNVTKRMETSTTPAIKSPMTTSRLLTGTESSLSFPEAKSKSNTKCYDSNSEMNAKRLKLEVPSSSSSLLSSLNVDSHCISESLEDGSSMGIEQKNLLGEHAYCNVTFDSICDQPFRTSAFTPSFTTMMNTMTSCYSCLNNIFHYLTTTDLLRAKLVCKCWYRLASQQFLWRKVSLKNITIVDWKKFAFALGVHGTTHLDLRGHTLFHDTWQNFVSVLNHLDKLQHIECGLVPGFVLYAMASKLGNLKSLTGECAMFSHWTTGRVGPCVINFNLFENISGMEKFQLRCKEGLMATVMGGLWPISHLTKLRHLSLTTLESVDCEQFKFLHKLNNLESLEIGDCSNWTSTIYAHVGKMVNLRTLRLEKGGETVDGLIEAVSHLTRLKELHLVIYKIPIGLGKILQGLEMLRLLSIWPNTATNGPFQNYKALHVVRTLTQLKELRWVILSDNCDIPDKAVMEEGNGWRDMLEDHKECQIDFSHPNSDVPLLPFAESKKISKLLPLKSTPYCTSINGLKASLQEALPSTTIKMFQVPTKQLRKYSAFR